MENQQHIKEEGTGFCDELLAKQDYLDYIDTDMEAFYAIKAEALGQAD